MLRSRVLGKQHSLQNFGSSTDLARQHPPLWYLLVSAQGAQTWQHFKGLWVSNLSYLVLQYKWLFGTAASKKSQIRQLADVQIYLYKTVKNQMPQIASHYS